MKLKPEFLSNVNSFIVIGFNFYIITVFVKIKLYYLKKQQITNND